MAHECDEQVQLTQLCRSTSLSLHSHQQVGSCANLRTDYFKARVALVFFKYGGNKEQTYISVHNLVTKGLETGFSLTWKCFWGFLLSFGVLINSTRPMCRSVSQNMLQQKQQQLFPFINENLSVIGSTAGSEPPTAAQNNPRAPKQWAPVNMCQTTVITTSGKTNLTDCSWLLRCHAITADTLISPFVLNIFSVAPLKLREHKCVPQVYSCTPPWPRLIIQCHSRSILI